VCGGQVVGGTDRRGAEPAGPRYGPADVAATVYRAIGLDPDTVVHDRQGRPLALCPDGRPIPGIL
jgi:hypothetical protein